MKVSFTASNCSAFLFKVNVPLLLHMYMYILFCKQQQQGRNCQPLSIKDSEMVKKDVKQKPCALDGVLFPQIGARGPFSCIVQVVVGIGTHHRATRHHRPSLRHHTSVRHHQPPTNGLVWRHHASASVQVDATHPARKTCWVHVRAAALWKAHNFDKVPIFLLQKLDHF